MYKQLNKRMTRKKFNNLPSNVLARSPSSQASKVSLDRKSDIIVHRWYDTDNYSEIILQIAQISRVLLNCKRRGSARGRAVWAPHSKLPPEWRGSRRARSCACLRACAHASRLQREIFEWNNQIGYLKWILKIVKLSQSNICYLKKYWNVWNYLISYQFSHIVQWNFKLKKLLQICFPFLFLYLKNNNNISVN